MGNIAQIRKVAIHRLRMRCICYGSISTFCIIILVLSSPHISKNGGLLETIQCHFISEEKCFRINDPDEANAAQMRMGLRPDLYEKTNEVEEAHASHTIAQIISDQMQHVDLIVDIGCGPGGVTSLLEKTFKNAAILAIDIDPAMIDYARKEQHRVQDEVDHLTLFLDDDISKPWDDLSKTVRMLENYVDIVWSNFALQWIPTDRRRQAVENFLRLLNNQGRFYLNIVLGFDLLESMVLEDKAMFTGVLNIPSSTKQAEAWMEYFDELGISHVEYNLMPQNEILNPIGNEAPYTRSYIRMYRPFLPPHLSNEEKDKVLDDIHESLQHSYLSKMSPDGSHNVTYYVLRVSGSK